MNHCISKILTVSMLTASVQAAAQQKPQPKPNILWIVSEDNSAYYLHCYGNRFATTPNIDQLAKNGFLYTHAYANSPVCAPARNAILTGAYAASNGNEQMRSYYYTSDQVGTYAGDQSMYDYMRSPACPFDELVKASERAIVGDKRQNFERYGLFDAILAEWLLQKWGIINSSDNP